MHVHLELAHVCASIDSLAQASIRHTFERTLGLQTSEIMEQHWMFQKFLISMLHFVPVVIFLVASVAKPFYRASDYWAFYCSHGPENLDAHVFMKCAVATLATLEGRGWPHWKPDPECIDRTPKSGARRRKRSHSGGSTSWKGSGGWNGHAAVCVCTHWTGNTRGDGHAVCVCTPWTGNGRCKG